MPKDIVIKKGNTTHFLSIYEPDEMPIYWEDRGQGHKEAVCRGSMCVVKKCDLQSAKKISAEFVNDLFSIPTCTHYDGETLSLYCGDAGSNWQSLFQDANKL